MTSFCVDRNDSVANFKYTVSFTTKSRGLAYLLLFNMFVVRTNIDFQKLRRTYIGNKQERNLISLPGQYEMTFFLREQT